MQPWIRTLAKITLSIFAFLVIVQICYMEEYDDNRKPPQEKSSINAPFFDRLLAKFFIYFTSISKNVLADKCSPGILNPYQVIQIEDLTRKEDNFESFQIKLDLNYIIERDNLPVNEKSTMNCTLELFDKQLNKSDSDRNFWHKNVSTVEVKLKIDWLLKFRVNSSGFYIINCLYSSEKKTFRPVYTEVFSILPSSIKTLVERNKASRKETEDLREKYASLDSETNPMLTDLKFEECEKLEGGELDNKMNVLVVGLGSVSYPNFKRTFPLTYKYLAKELENNLMFENLNIVGENTYPNMLPLLSGVIEEANAEIDLGDETQFFRDDLNQSSFNDLYPFIWNEFEKLGYATMYRQDEPKMSTFDYLKNGFRYVYVCRVKTNNDIIIN